MDSEAMVPGDAIVTAMVPGDAIVTAIARELCFPKQHYKSIVPSKPGINR